MTIKIKEEIESLCWKAGVPPKEVAEIVITPMTISFTIREVPIGGDAYDKVIRTLPYAYEDGDGGQEESTDES